MLFDLGAPLGFDESFKQSRYLQDQFISALELPTYHAFHNYQFLDVLDALSFRLMILEYIIQYDGEGLLPTKDGIIDETEVKVMLE